MSLIPIRWQIMMILNLSTLTIFVLRINMSVAALAIAEDQKWTETEMGRVLASLYYGYAAGQLPFNFFSQKYGGTVGLGLSVCGSCLINLFLPLAVRSSMAWTILLQILGGFFQAGAFPSAYYLYPRWMPISERTIMVAFVVTGVYMGEIIGLGLSGYLVNSPNLYLGNLQIGSWDSCFYVTSLFGVVWFPLFYYFVYDSPSEHPRITDAEYEFIHKGSGFHDESEERTQAQLENERESKMIQLTKLEEGETESDLNIMESQFNPIKPFFLSPPTGDNNEGEQVSQIIHSHFVEDCAAYNSVKQTFVNDPEIDSQVSPLTGSDSEQEDVVNPLYLTVSQEEKTKEVSKGTHLAPWLHGITILNQPPITPLSDLTLHPDWHPALPPGRLHHHYHTHHSHKLKLHKIPWLKIFTNTASLALLVNTFAQGWVSLMILSEMPAFLHQQLGLDIAHSSYLSILPYLCNLLSVEIFSVGFNQLMVRGILTRRKVRQWANRIGLLGPALCMVIVGHTTDPTVGVTILCVALFLFGAVQSGTPCGFMDIAPNFSSEMNTVAIVFLSCAGFLTPMLVSSFQRENSLQLAWQSVFYMTFMICFVAIIIWKIFGVSEIIPELNSRIQ